MTQPCKKTIECYINCILIIFYQTKICQIPVFLYGKFLLKYIFLQYMFVFRTLMEMTYYIWHYKQLLHYQLLQVSLIWPGSQMDTMTTLPCHITGTLLFFSVYSRHLLYSLHLWLFYVFCFFQFLYYDYVYSHRLTKTILAELLYENLLGI